MDDSPAARAYTAVAAEYDDTLREAAWIRQRLWKRYLRAFRPGDHVLDVGCGTGSDAVFLAQHGIRVTAIDVSAGMIAELQTKIDAHRLSHLITPVVADHTDLRMFPDATFDGMVSAFAALNTHPDLRAFAAEAARVLKPGAHAVLHLLNRFTWWEWLRCVLTLRLRDARDLRNRTRRVVTIGGTKVPHALYAPEELRATFGAQFSVRVVSGMGFLLPWSWAARMPRGVQAAMGVVESLMDGTPLHVRGSYFLRVELERK